jgi:hypothetical protein
MEEGYDQETHGASRFARWWNRPPAKFTGSVLANRLGWQLIRIFWFNLSRRLGRVPVAPDIQALADTLRTEGVVRIEDFLPPEVFARIRVLYEAQLAETQTKPLASPYIVKAGHKTRIDYARLVPEPGSELHTLLDTHLMKNDFLRRLGATIVHTPIVSYRDPQIFYNKRRDATAPDLNTDIYYHADTSYPGVKAFLYLSDTDTDNGAFTYAQGSHRLTFKRLVWEYRKSIEVARARAANARIIGDETGRSWHCLTREEEQREGVRGTAQVGAANTLMMFNVMGFHRRGDIQSDRPREFVLVYYRT